MSRERNPLKGLAMAAGLAMLLITSEAANTYSAGDILPVLVNTVGPYYNPSETYPYYRLPLCRPATIKTVSSLGGNLEGDKLANSLYKLRYREDKGTTSLCNLKLKPTDVEQLKNAIEQLYFFELIIDDLPLSGFVGYLDEKKGTYPHSHDAVLFTHHHFLLHYNDDKIIFANITQSRTLILPPADTNRVVDLDVPFTYSVAWEPTNVKWENRIISRVNLNVHWLSITNSIVLVILMTGFVALILMRVIKSDFARYSRDEEDMEGFQDDYGWKLINGDVFRLPPHRHLLCAIIGVGSQFLTVTGCLLAMAMLGFFQAHNHGHINKSSVVLYAFTSSIAGYMSSSTYKHLGGTQWVNNIIITCLAFMGPLLIIWSVLNTIAWMYASTQALPATTVMQLLLLWLLVGAPLTVIGGIVGKNSATPLHPPCRTKVIPREIPKYPWYRSRFVHMLFGGFLPFSAISIELYYIFLTLWGRHLYTLYGILTLVFAILLVVTACVSVTLTYFQLSMEDYRWWWPSIINVGTTGLYVIGYAVFYYIYRSHMSGLLQSCNYFGYSIVLCAIISCMLGTIGFFSSLRFVKYIYSTIKTD